MECIRENPLLDNPLVVLGGFWEQKKGKLILRCKSDQKPRVKVKAECNQTNRTWNINPDPSSFSTIDLCKDKNFLKPGELTREGSTL